MKYQYLAKVAFNFERHCNCNFWPRNYLPYYATAMTMARALSITPVRPSIGTYICPYATLNDVRSLRRIFLSEFMKLSHIVKYHDVLFKFDNGPYRTMLSGVMAFCLCFDQNFMKLGHII